MGQEAYIKASNTGVLDGFGCTLALSGDVKASNTGRTDFFGSSVALSSEGSTLAVGAVDEKSAATGINGNQFNDFFTFAGAVYVLTRSATTWSQQAYVKASNTRPESFFGSSVALSVDGLTLAVGADHEDGGALAAGAVYVYH